MSGRIGRRGAEMPPRTQVLHSQHDAPTGEAAGKVITAESKRFRAGWASRQTPEETCGPELGGNSPETHRTLRQGQSRPRWGQQGSPEQGVSGEGRLRTAGDRAAGCGAAARPTWLAHLLVPICRLMVEWSMGGRMWFLGSYRCLLVPYAVMPDWLAHLLVPICRGRGRRGLRGLP